MELERGPEGLSYRSPKIIITIKRWPLANLPIYHLSLFKIPASLDKKLEKFQRDFFWE